MKELIRIYDKQTYKNGLRAKKHIDKILNRGDSFVFVDNDEEAYGLIFDHIDVIDNGGFVEFYLGHKEGDIVKELFWWGCDFGIIIDENKKQITLINV